MTRTRRTNALKYGFAVGVEQPLGDGGDTGLFARFGWNDGHTETFCYTEADWSLSLGAQLAGVLKQKHHVRVHCKNHRPASQAGRGLQGIGLDNE